MRIARGIILPWLAGLFVLAMLVGCTTSGPQMEWGPAYDDVPVASGFEPFDNPAFHREDTEGGRRIYGRYAYRAEGLYAADQASTYFKAELPKKGWTFVNETSDPETGTWSARFEKGDDKLDLKLRPDSELHARNRFSVLVVTLNDPYGN